MLYVGLIMGMIIGSFITVIVFSVSKTLFYGSGVSRSVSTAGGHNTVARKAEHLNPMTFPLNDNYERDR